MIKRTLGSRRDDLYDPDAARREILFVVRRFGSACPRMFARDNGMSLVYFSLLSLLYPPNCAGRTSE